MSEAREENTEEDAIVVTPKKMRERKIVKSKIIKKIILDKIFTVDQKNHFWCRSPTFRRNSLSLFSDDSDRECLQNVRLKLRTEASVELKGLH